MNRPKSRDPWLACHEIVDGGVEGLPRVVDRLDVQALGELAVVAGLQAAQCAVDPITVRALDDVKVATVGILIVGPGDTVIEQGQMTQDAIDKTTWAYTATADASCDHVKLLVDIGDLPGHITHETIEKDI